jgi:hypothetical protein
MRSDAAVISPTEHGHWLAHSCRSRRQGARRVRIFPRIFSRRPADQRHRFRKLRESRRNVQLKIADLVPSGTGAELNGHLFVDEYPQLAVDRSAGRARGTVYVTYPDGRNHVVPDASSASGNYAFPDIFVAKSTNSGRSFTALGAVSPTPKDFTGLGRDQFLPAIAVDKDGVVAVCYYDRRNDRPNLRVDRFCSVSETQGRRWKDQQASSVNWLPTMNVDPISLGGGFGISEYDSLTSDFLRQNDGFFGAFIIEINGHQNVVATKFGDSETTETEVAQTCSEPRCPVSPVGPVPSVEIEPREPRVDRRRVGQLIF